MIRMEIKTRVLPADEAGVAEAAQLLHIGVSAVSMRLHRARKMLREQLGRDQ